MTRSRTGGGNAAVGQSQRGLYRLDFSDGLSVGLGTAGRRASSRQLARSERTSLNITVPPCFRCLPRMPGRRIVAGGLREFVIGHGHVNRLSRPRRRPRRGADTHCRRPDSPIYLAANLGQPAACCQVVSTDVHALDQAELADAPA